MFTSVSLKVLHLMIRLLINIYNANLQFLEPYVLNRTPQQTIASWLSFHIKNISLYCKVYINDDDQHFYAIEEKYQKSCISLFTLW